MKKFKAMNNGWMMFSEYCAVRGIPKTGYHHRRLQNKLADEHKENLTPSSPNATWAINIKAADKVFIKK